MNLKGLAKSVRAKIAKERVDRLPDDFRGVLGQTAPIHHGLTGETAIWSDAKRTIPMEYENVHRLFQEYRRSSPGDKGKMFAQLCKMLDEIAPKGCYFTKRYGMWGFWEDDV